MATPCLSSSLCSLMRPLTKSTCLEVTVMTVVTFVAVGLHGRIIAFGFGVDDFRGVYANFILLDPFAFQECDDFALDSSISL